MIDNFKPYDTAQLVQTSFADSTISTTQTIAQGPVASQIAIKQLGSNGGGYFNVNSSHPYENPTPFSNFLEVLSILLIASGLTYYLGRMVKNQKHGWAVWSAMLYHVLGRVAHGLAFRGGRESTL